VRFIFQRHPVEFEHPAHNPRRFFGHGTKPALPFRADEKLKLKQKKF
jgi:hypothetical protein